METTTIDLIAKSYQPISQHVQFGILLPKEIEVNTGYYVKIREYHLPEGTQKEIKKIYTGREKIILIKHVISGPKQGLLDNYNLVSFLYV